MKQDKINLILGNSDLIDRIKWYVKYGNKDSMWGLCPMTKSEICSDDIDECSKLCHLLWPDLRQKYNDNEKQGKLQRDYSGILIGEITKEQWKERPRYYLSFYCPDWNDKPVFEVFKKILSNLEEDRVSDRI